MGALGTADPSLPAVLLLQGGQGSNPTAAGRLARLALELKENSGIFIPRPGPAVTTGGPRGVSTAEVCHQDFSRARMVLSDFQHRDEKGLGDGG